MPFLLTFFPLKFCSTVLDSIALVVMTDDILAVNTDNKIIPEIIQSDAKSRPGIDFGALSPYLQLEN